jgi:hypothetical protein
MVVFSFFFVGNRPVSGFMEYDYPALMQKHMMTDNQFSVIHSSPIPSELSEMLNRKSS